MESLFKGSKCCPKSLTSPRSSHGGRLISKLLYEICCKTKKKVSQSNSQKYYIVRDEVSWFSFQINTKEVVTYGLMQVLVSLLF